MNTYCTECHGRLFAKESQECGVCTECREGEDLHADLAASDAEDRLDAALADDVFAVEAEPVSVGVAL